MVVAALESETHEGGFAPGLVDETAGVHATGGGDGAEPVDVVLHGKETAGDGEGSKHVVVDGHGAGGAGVGVEVLGEPHVLANDLAGSLDVLASALLLVRDTPAGSTTGTGLLGEAEGDTADESGGNHGALAVTGAARHTEALGVDTRRSSAHLLETIDETVDTPGPSGKGTGGVGAAKEVVEETAATGRTTGLGSEGIVAEADGGDGTGDRDGGATNTDDGGVGTSARGLADRSREGNGLAADGDADSDAAAAHGGLDLVGGRGVGAELVLLEHLVDLLATALELGLGGDLGTGGIGERIGELGHVDGRVRVGDRAGLALKDLASRGGNGEGRAAGEEGGCQMDHGEDAVEAGEQTELMERAIGLSSSTW